MAEAGIVFTGLPCYHAEGSVFNTDGTRLPEVTCTFSKPDSGRGDTPLSVYLGSAPGSAETVIHSKAQGQCSRGLFVDHRLSMRRKSDPEERKPPPDRALMSL